MFLLEDPMFYICMITSVSVIYLVALAGSGRDNAVQAPGEKITTPFMRNRRGRKRNRGAVFDGSIGHSLRSPANTA